jgi:hypothetical protein
MSSLPRVAISFNRTPFPLTLLNIIPFIVLTGESSAEGERYGNSSRPSCICFGGRNGVNHIFHINI